VKMTRRRWLWIAVALLAPAMAAAYLLMFMPSRFNQAKCDRIQIGWTLAQVEALLGKGQYFSGMHVWSDQVGDTIFVDFDANGRVFDKRCIHDNLTNTERLYRRARMSIRQTLDLPPEP
jgi:hypothetical protein